MPGLFQDLGYSRNLREDGRIQHGLEWKALHCLNYKADQYPGNSTDAKQSQYVWSYRSSVFLFLSLFHPVHPNLCFSHWQRKRLWLGVELSCQFLHNQLSIWTTDYCLSLEELWCHHGHVRNHQAFFCRLSTRLHLLSVFAHNVYSVFHSTFPDSKTLLEPLLLGLK